MKKVLVTGSEGYIGQHLCKMLREDPTIDLYCIDQFMDKVPQKNAVDIRVKDHVKYRMKSGNDFDTVIHLAALVQVGESVKYPSAYYITNVKGTMNVLKHIKYDNFIFASTGAASKPDSPYGFSKRMAEDVVKEWAPNYTIFRFYNVIGSDGFEPTNPDGLFYKLKKAPSKGKFSIYGENYNTKDGTCVREYVHVNDICKAIIKAIDKPSNKIENLAYGDTRTVKEIVEIFKKVNNVDFDVIYKDARPGDLETCYLEHPSEYMERNYSYEKMLKT
jgi:UDP-glucose 4-epimerase